MQRTVQLCNYEQVEVKRHIGYVHSRRYASSSFLFHQVMARDAFFRNVLSKSLSIRIEYAFAIIDLRAI
jgi:hypothetical protein